MKTIQIHGSYHQVINEDAASDWFSSIMKPGGWFGELCTNLFSNKEVKGDSKALSEYEKARQAGIKSFKDQRKKEIEAKIKHQDKLRAEHLKSENTLKLNKMKADEAERKAKRDAELSEARRITAELAREGKRIDEWVSRSAPKDPEELKDILNTCNKISQDIPSQTRMLNNFAGMLNDMCYNDSDPRQFITNKEDREKRMEEKYGKDWREKSPFNDPEIKSQIEAFEKERDKDLKSLAGKEGDELEKAKQAIENKTKQSCMRVMPGYSDNVKTEEQEKTEEDVLNQVYKAMEEREAKAKEAKDKLDEANKTLSKLEKQKKHLQDLTDNVNNAKQPESIKEKLGDLYTTEGDGDNVTYTLNKESKAYKMLEAAGLDEAKIKELAGGTGGDAAIDNIVKNMQNDPKTYEAIKDANAQDAQKELDKANAKGNMQQIEDSIKATKTAIEGDSTTKGYQAQYDEASKSSIEITVKGEDGQDTKKQISEGEIRVLCGNVSDPSKSLSSNTIAQEIEKRKSVQQAREAQLEASTQAFKQAVQQTEDAEKRAKIKPNDTTQNQMNELKPQTPTFTKNDDDSITIDRGDDNPVTINKGDKAYDLAQSAVDDPNKANLFIKPEEEPKLPETNDENVQQEYLIKHKQWELNQEALKQSKNIAYQNDPKTYDELNDTIKDFNNPKKQDSSGDTQTNNDTTQTNNDTNGGDDEQLDAKDFEEGDKYETEDGTKYYKKDDKFYKETKDGKSEEIENFDDWLKEVEYNTDFNQQSQDEGEEGENDENYESKDGSTIFKRKKKNGKGSTYIRKSKEGKESYATKKEFLAAKKRAQKKKQSQPKNDSYQLKSLKSFLLESLKK